MKEKNQIIEQSKDIIRKCEEQIKDLEKVLKIKHDKEKEVSTEEIK